MLFRSWRDTLPRFALRPAAMDNGRYERFEAFLLDQGLINETTPIGDYAVQLD